MGIRTKKVGITGKYATRYGQKLRKQVKSIEILQRVKSICPFCGKKSIRREAAGIWKCRGCRRAIAGGAWEFVTTAATTAKTTINRLKKNLESRKKPEKEIDEDEEEEQKPKKGQKDKEESINKINFEYNKDLAPHASTLKNDNTINNNKNCFKKFGFFIAILILWVAEENFLLIYLDIFKDLDIWFLELIFISLIFRKFFVFKIHSHQILGMAISMCVGTLLKIYNIVIAFTSDEDDKTLYSKNPYVCFFIILYFLLISARSYVNTQLKVFMDLKYISQRALLMFYGIIGTIMCLITGLIVSFVPCPEYMKDYICKINYEKELY